MLTTVFSKVWAWKYFFNVFKRSLSCSQRLHSFDKNTIKNSNYEILLQFKIAILFF